MDLGIKGRKAIVCASSKGLGRGCAEALAEAGCELFLNARGADVLEATADAIRQRYGAPVTTVPGDISDPAIREKLLAACPSPDILVNNNGGPPRRDFRDLDRDRILAGVDQNMVTPLELIRAVLDGMVERRFGRIVNITSLSVYMSIPGLDLSSGARAGLTAFLAGISRTVAADNVTINSLLPGKFDTDRIRSGLKAPGDPDVGLEEQLEKLRQGVPAGRLGDPAEFGKVCAFLCSVHAGYMTGQNIILDGGLYPSAF